ncbi:MAG: DUF3276 family protein [Rikenellaceae bacterium]|nr:DUF3276 family protein [Rikenellaceae bacterium]MBR2452276.1 DUF3276 family protein [Rikenellaceae bacterium]
MNEDKFRREETDGSEDVYSKVVRAGKRTYFFDVKSTRNGDLFLTITESRKRMNSDGTSRFEKNKIYLYKEDFDKYADGLNEVMEFVKKNKPDYFEQNDSCVTPTEESLSIDEEFDRL